MSTAKKAIFDDFDRRDRKKKYPKTYGPPQPWHKQKYCKDCGHMAKDLDTTTGEFASTGVCAVRQVRTRDNYLACVHFR